MISMPPARGIKRDLNQGQITGAATGVLRLCDIRQLWEAREGLNVQWLKGATTKAEMHWVQYSQQHKMKLLWTRIQGL